MPRIDCFNYLIYKIKYNNKVLERLEM